MKGFSAFTGYFIAGIWIACTWFFMTGHSIGQNSNRGYHQTISNSSVLIQLEMNGTLDGQNTLTRKRWGVERAFEPMVSVSMTNTGDQVIKHPRLVFNNRGNWFTIDHMLAECTAGAQTNDEKLRSIWQFVNRNRFHAHPAQTDAETWAATKLLGVYGYGTCGIVTMTMKHLAEHAGFRVRHWRLDGHVVSEILMGGKGYIFDSDTETFYLSLDNKTIASKKAVNNDRYLIKRTHHGGIAYPHSSYRSDHLSTMYDPADNINTAKVSDHRLDFDLRPGETIRFSWNDDVRYHHYNPNGISFREEEIGNGSFILRTDFENAPLSRIFSHMSNMSTTSQDGRSPNLHQRDPGRKAWLILPIKSPFVITGGKIRLHPYFSNAGQLVIHFSKDQASWTPIWQNEPVHGPVDSIDLDPFINTLGSPATYVYYLGFEWLPDQSNLPAGLDSLEVVSNFQVNKFFMPALQLGQNTITYADGNTNGRLLDLNIRWKESSENTPPVMILGPVFPGLGDRVDSLQFTLEWLAPKDPDGDPITDFEFILSDHAEVKYPLSPNFHGYTSALSSGGGGVPQYRIPWPGLLNHGQRYYWKVRAKDQRGAWGKWSPVWHFTPEGVMPPEDVVLLFNERHLGLHWQHKQGKKPSYYEIHGSNEANGFTPGPSTLITTTDSTYWWIDLIEKPLTGYRVIAVDAYGCQSGPSELRSIPYPMAFYQTDTINPGKAFSLTLLLNRAWLAVWRNRRDTLRSNPSITILRQPSWLAYHKGERQFEGILPLDQGNIFPYDSLQNSIRIKLEDRGLGKVHYQTIRLASYLEKTAGSEPGSSNPVTVFPTLTRDFILVDTPEPLDWKLYDLSGNLVKCLQLDNNRTFVPVNDLPPGVYIWQTGAGKAIQSGKFTVIR